MSTYLYSFIIPHRNAPSLLQRCIGSIPDRDDIEIIVVDDNSDDSSKPNVERNNVSIICLDALNSRGAGHARNVGLSHAKGKWVLFIDADDAYSPHLTDLLDKYKNADVNVVYFGYAKIFNKGKKTASVWPSPEELDKDPQYVSKYFRKVPWNKMVKREFIEQHHIHFEQCLFALKVYLSHYSEIMSDRMMYVHHFEK